MKLNIGTNDKKKVVILACLVVVAIVVFWINSSSSGVPAGAPTPTAADPVTTTPLVAPRRPQPAAVEAPKARPSNARTSGANRALLEFRPSLKPKKPEDRPDPMSIDPTLRLDALVRMQQMKVEGVHRNIFDFGQAPPPPTEASVKGPGGKKIALPNPVIDPQANLNAQAVTPPPKPPPPKIPWKFFGFIAGKGPAPKRAFFLEGDDIYVVTEGDVVKRRFRIVRIGVNSVVVEDIDFHNEQTLPLEEVPAG